MQYRLLLAIEEHSTREFYSTSLTSAGFEVVPCAPDDALRIALATRPDVVVIDGSRFPGQSACGEFKSNAAFKRLPLIALAPPHGASQIDKQCDAVLPVDCLPGALVDTIDRVLSTHHGRH
jgi:DNA-binding response OmpR family regulator